MSKRVNLPNGYIANFPDDMSNDDIAVVLRKQFPPTNAPTTADLQQLKPTGNVMETQEHTPAPPVAETLTSFGENVGKGAFNIGGMIGSRVNPNYEAERDARAERNPVAATAGYLTGAAAGGGPLVRAARAIPGVAAVAGQGVRNVLRLAGIGAAGAAAQAGGEGGDVPTGAVEGAVAGPIGTGVVKMARSVGRAAKGLVSASQRDTNAVRTLARNYKLTPDEMTAALDNFQTQNGRQASLADIADLHSKGTLKQFAAKNPAFGVEVANEAERRTTLAPKATTRDLNQPTDAPSLTTYRKKRMDDAMKPFENNPVKLSKSVLDALVEPDIYETLPRTQKRQIQNARDGTTPLTVRDMDNLRQTFAGKAGEGDSARYGEYAKSIEALTQLSEPRYGTAMNQWRRDSNFIDAFKHGRGGGTQTKGGNPMLQAALDSPEGRQGYTLGSRERIAASNVEDVAPGFIKSSDGMSNAEAAHLAVAGAKAGSPWAVYHLIRAIPSIKASDNTLRLAAKYFLDPKMARQGVALLKQSKASDADIAQIVAATVGTAAGGAQ